MSVGEAARPVHRFQFSTGDEAEAEQFIHRIYVGNKSRFGAIHDGARFSATVAKADGIAVSFLRSTIDYFTVTEPFDYFCPIALSHGRVCVKRGRDETILLPGEPFLYPLGTPLGVDTFDIGTHILQLPTARLAALAEETAGIAPSDLRWESVTPVSAAMARQYFALMGLASSMLLAESSPAAHPLVADQLARMAAVTALRTFPNTAMTVSYRSGPGWVAPAAVRRAAGFIEAHADQPLTLGQISAAAGLSGRALQTTFRRYYGTTPTGFLRRVRLERAHQELRTADPASGVTVTAVARRWGWVSHSGFTAMYRQRFGRSPGQTLRAQD